MMSHNLIGRTHPAEGSASGALTMSWSNRHATLTAFADGAAFRAGQHRRL